MILFSLGSLALARNAGRQALATCGHLHRDWLGQLHSLPHDAAGDEKGGGKVPRQVKVVFYDVWTPQGAPYGQQYKIRAIPIQVFLDRNGKEYFRHEGFFDFETLEKAVPAR